MKDVMIVYLKHLNENATPDEIITKLTYMNGKDEEYVEDYSYFLFS